MSLGVVIANIAGPVRQLPASSPAPAVKDAGGGTSSTATSANAVPAASGQPQLASNFTVVVLQILNEQGVVTATIPSAQQLAAYKAGTAQPPE